MSRGTMSVEMIELRKILTQMLADNGINRNTISDLVKKIVSEKVDSAVDQKVHHEINLDGMIKDQVLRGYTSNYMTHRIEQAVKDHIREMRMNVQFAINDMPENLTPALLAVTESGNYLGIWPLKTASDEPIAINEIKEEAKAIEDPNIHITKIFISPEEAKAAK